jgi:DNA-binding transcriptional LysR family regulator
LRLVSANTRAITRSLLERRLDIALVEGPVEHPRIEARRWRSDELVLIAPPDHRLVARGKVRAHDLLTERFVVREQGSGTREVAERALSQHGVHPSIALQLGSTEAVKQAVAAGLGLAIVSRYAAADQLALGRIALLRLRDVELGRALTELRLKGRMPSAPAAEFVEYLRA